jgi:hypothetical protein
VRHGGHAAGRQQRRQERRGGQGAVVTVVGIGDVDDIVDLRGDPEGGVPDRVEDAAVSRFMRSAIRKIAACTGSISPARIAAVPRRASSAEIFLDRSGPVAMRWMIERMVVCGSAPAALAEILISNS